MKTVVLIDGGYLRACAHEAKRNYDNDFIVKFASRCSANGEYLVRILYYDAPRFSGKVQLPVSGRYTELQGSDRWLRDLAKLERFAVRRGRLGFRGWRLKSIPISERPLTDDDFSPMFEQKGVDMRIGLDIATFAGHRSVDRIVIVSADTDMAPAMKHARIAGLEIVIVRLPPPARELHEALLAHSDIVRNVDMPQP